MSSLKLRKIAKIVKEMNTNPSQSRYDISGLTLGLCKFFYRTSQQLFQDLGQGDYTIDTSSNSQVLVIQNSELLKTMEAIQVCYILDTTSSKYETDFNVDINQLKDEYNHLVDDVHALWDYVKRVGMVSDDTTIPLILPQLDTNELWIKTEDGYQGISLTDAEGVLKGVITEYTNEMKSLLDQYVENPLKPRLDAHVEEVNKPELDRYVEEINKPDLDEYTKMLEERLQTMIDQAVGDKGLIPNGKDWFEIELGNWLVTDLFNKNYKNYPPQLTSSDNAGVVKKDISDGGRTQVIRYYTTTGKMFFAVRVNEVWSEWQEVGGSADSMQFTQANHGFVFTAVTLDGATRKWTKANKYTGADGIAVKVDNDRFDVVIRGVVNIPANARDDKGNAYAYDEYYFLSQDVNGGLTIDKPVIGTFQSLIHVSELDGKQVAYVDVQNPVSLDYTVLDSDTADMIGIGTYKTTLRTADTIADLKGLDLKVGDVVEVLGYYTKGDGANHKRKIADSDDGSGVQLANSLWANLIYNKEINISWIGCKPNDDSYALQNSNIINKFLAREKTNVFIPNGTWYFQQIKFNSYCGIRGENRFNTILQQALDIDNIAYEPNKNNGFIQSLDTDSYWVGRHSTTKFCKFENFTLIGKKQDKIRALSFSSFKGDLELGNIRDSCSIISNIEIKNFYDGLYIGYYYKEMRVENIHTYENANSGIIIVGTDNFITNCTSNHNDKNGIEILGSEVRFELSKCFGNKNAGFYLTQQCVANNISTQENEIYGILIEGSAQVYSLTNVFFGSNGCTPGEIVPIKENSSAVTIKGNYNKLNIVGISSDYRAGGEPEKNGYSYSRYFVDIDGKYNIISGKLNSITKFTKLFNLGNNRLQTFILNNQDISKEYLLGQFDFNKEMLLANVVIEKDSSARYVGLYGELDIKSTKIGYKTTEYDGKFGFNFVLQFSNENGVTFITRNVRMIEYLNLKAYYKLIDTNKVQVVITTTVTGGGYFKYYFKTDGYDSSLWLNPDEYREGFINDGSYNGLTIKNDDPVEIATTLNTPYHTAKMMEEGGTTLTDFYSYMDEKVEYDKQLEAEERAKYEAYQLALRENPELSYDDFLTGYPTTISTLREPVIPQSVKNFMDKYL